MSFTIYPAIDLSGGKAVRLLRGERERMRVVSDDPVQLAVRLESEGACHLHVVDLDAAFGAGDNMAVIDAILRVVLCPVQVGGGVRSAGKAEALRRAGAARVILGTAALRDPQLLLGLLAEDRDAVVVAADARAGRVVASAWTEDGGETLPAFAARMAAVGVPRLLVTTVERDGTGEGLDLDALATAVDAFGPGVMASGGVGAVVDVSRLEALARRGLDGVVVGSLLVDGRASVADLVSVVAGWKLDEVS